MQICKNLKVPMVLDIHHHNCKNEGEYIGDLLEEIFIDKRFGRKRQAFFTYSYIQGNGGRGGTEYTK